MGKITKSIIIDEEDWEYLQSLRVNISAEIRDYLRQLRSIKDGDVDGINIRLEEEKLKRNVKNMQDLQLQIKESEEIIQKYGEIQQKKKEEKLEKEKEIVDKLNQCANCGNTINEERRVEIKENVFMCKSCYHTVEVKKFL